MNSRDAILYEKEYLCPTYTRPDALFVKGIGSRVYDAEGNSYLDLVGGLGVLSLGHCHPVFVEEIKLQLQTLIHTSNLYHTELQLLLAKMLSELSLEGKVFFANSGAEANEAAIKLARLYRDGRFKILTAEGSFHGRTLATLSATAQEKVQKGFKPLVPHFSHFEFNNLSSIEIDEETSAIMVEPIQGERGVYPADKEFLEGLRKLCNKEDILLIFDEVQTGIGRTGSLFAYQEYGVIPDIITLAKGLGGGIPIGCMIARKGLGELLGPGMHASTLGGNPIATRAGLSVLSILNKELLAGVRENGNCLKEKLRRLPRIKEVRGMGLMIGIEIDGDANSVVKMCFKNGLLVNAPNSSCVRLLPPLIITKEEIDEGVSILKRVLNGL
ncbi:TPA: aspartate aminotransferase family protein [bacterium]|nr:aspartate aminotransferase family protein [bacterium]